MPIYEYRCTACQHKLEALQKFSDAPLLKCPECGQDALTKLVSAAGFHLKGSGWYQTDFKGSGSKAPAATTASGGDAKPAEGGAAKSGDAPAAKADAKPAAATPSTPSTPSTP